MPVKVDRADWHLLILRLSGEVCITITDPGWYYTQSTVPRRLGPIEYLQNSIVTLDSSYVGQTRVFTFPILRLSGHTQKLTNSMDRFSP